MVPSRTVISLNNNSMAVSKNKNIKKAATSLKKKYITCLKSKSVEVSSSGSSSNSSLN